MFSISSITNKTTSFFNGFSSRLKSETNTQNLTLEQATASIEASDTLDEDCDFVKLETMKTSSEILTEEENLVEVSETSDEDHDFIELETMKTNSEIPTEEENLVQVYETSDKCINLLKLQKSSETLSNVSFIDYLEIGRESRESNRSEMSQRWCSKNNVKIEYCHRLKKKHVDDIIAGRKTKEKSKNPFLY